VVSRGAGQKISATIECYSSEKDAGRGVVANAAPLDQKLAVNDGSISPLAETGFYSRTNPDTRTDFTDWGNLLLPAVKAKGIFTR
jgi:hypothetical protein